MNEHDQQRRIAIDYLEFLTRSLRQAERRRREEGELTEALRAATWAERAHELRLHLLGITHDARP